MGGLMKRKPEWVVEMRKRIAIALANPDLYANGWDEGFLQDIDERLRRYGTNVRLTEKQEAVLFRLPPLLPPSSLETQRIR
jgi:hypothetical protein